MTSQVVAESGTSAIMNVTAAVRHPQTGQSTGERTNMSSFMTIICQTTIRETLWSERKIGLDRWKTQRATHGSLLRIVKLRAKAGSGLFPSLTAGMNFSQQIS
jgi:hypothetical protein